MYWLARDELHAERLNEKKPQDALGRKEEVKRGTGEVPGKKSPN